jgi:membrane associated rhomboid family serine protease
MFPIADENEPGYGPAWVTLAFIALNILVFVLLQLPDDRFTYAFSAIPYEITTGTDLTEPETVEVQGQQFEIPQEPGPDPIWFTLLSSMFMHGGWLHLGGNMLFLWIFGDNVEHFAGHVVFPLFYVISGIAAAFAQILVAPDSVVPTLGASGAISGVLGAYLVLFPTNRVTVIFGRFPAQVPALVAVGLWAVFQFINGFGALYAAEETVGGVAYMAHIGGFVAGLVGGFVFRAMGGNRPRRRQLARGMFG